MGIWVRHTAGNVGGDGARFEAGNLGRGAQAPYISAGAVSISDDSVAHEGLPPFAAGAVAADIALAALSAGASAAASAAPGTAAAPACAAASGAPAAAAAPAARASLGSPATVDCAVWQSGKRGRGAASA